MPRKPARQPPDDQIVAMYAEILTKLESPVLNGGFETLVVSVKNLERLVEKLASDHVELQKVLYEPDDGLFARVKKVEANHKEEYEPLKRDVAELSEWRVEMIAKDGPIATAERDHERVDVLHAWKNRLIGFFVSTFGATVLVVGKTVYEYVRDHVTLH